MRTIAATLCLLLLVLFPIYSAHSDDEKLLQELEIEITIRDLSKEAIKEATERAESLIKKSKISKRSEAISEKWRKARDLASALFWIKSDCSTWGDRYFREQREECERRVESKLNQYPRFKGYDKAMLEIEYLKCKKRKTTNSSKNGRFT